MQKQSKSKISIFQNGHNTSTETIDDVNKHNEINKKKHNIPNSRTKSTQLKPLFNFFNKELKYYSGKDFLYKYCMQDTTTVSASFETKNHDI